MTHPKADEYWARHRRIVKDLSRPQRARRRQDIAHAVTAGVCYTVAAYLLITVEIAEPPIVWVAVFAHLLVGTAAALRLAARISARPQPRPTPPGYRRL